MSIAEVRLHELEVVLRTRLFKVRRIREVCRMADLYIGGQEQNRLQIDLVNLANRVADDRRPERGVK